MFMGFMQIIYQSCDATDNKTSTGYILLFFEIIWHNPLDELHSPFIIINYL